MAPDRDKSAEQLHMIKDMRNVMPFICDRTALDSDQRLRHQAVLQELRGAVRELRELTDGYAFRLPADPDRWTLATEFVSLERRCCPFLAFGLDLEAGGGPYGCG